MNLVDQIKRYVVFNEQEKCDKLEILKHLDQTKNIFHRNNKAAHMTASAWVVNKDKTKVLMIHHNIYNSWSWMGGHADGENNLMMVAQREVTEESGVENIGPLSDDIYSLEILTVDGHEKNGEYISSHLHFNITYLFEADEKEVLTVKHDENSDVSWFKLDEAINASTEPWFQTRIYNKLNQKLRAIE